MDLRNRYTLLSRLGGAGSQTYLALDRVSFQKRAVKLLDLSSFQRELHILQRLKGGCYPKLLDAWQDADRGVIVLEYIEGGTLESLLRNKGRLPEEEIIRIAVELISVLVHLHAMQPPILHLDLKPANILLDKQGKVFLTDFGNSREVWVDGMDRARGAGTPGYAAPEQYEAGGYRNPSGGRMRPNGSGSAGSGTGHDEQISVQTDIFGFGKVLERMMTGYGKESYFSREGRKKKRPADKRYSCALRRVMKKAIRGNRGRPYRTAEEIRRDLLKRNRKRMPNKIWILGMAALIVVFGVYGIAARTLRILDRTGYGWEIAAGNGREVEKQETSVPEGLRERMGRWNKLVEKKCIYQELQTAGKDFVYPAEELRTLLWEAELEIDSHAKTEPEASIMDYRALCNLYLLRESELGRTAGIRLESAARSALVLIQQLYADAGNGEMMTRKELLSQEVYFLDILAGRTTDADVRQGLEMRLHEAEEELERLEVES